MDCNGGKPFGIWDDWERVGRRIGIRRIEFGSRETVPEPMLRFDSPGPEATAVLYLPPPPCRKTLYLWLLHEFSEMIMARELAPPLCYPAEWGDHHQMAQVVEKRQARPAFSLKGFETHP